MAVNIVSRGTALKYKYFISLLVLMNEEYGHVKTIPVDIYYMERIPTVYLQYHNKYTILYNCINIAQF